VSIDSPGSDSPTAPNETVEFQESSNGTNWTGISGCFAQTLTWNSTTHLGTASCAEALDASQSGVEVRAISSGDTNFLPSTSLPATQTVNQADTDVTPTTVPTIPVTGQTTVITGTLGLSSPGADSPSAPTGTMAFEISTNAFTTYSDLPGCTTQSIAWNSTTHIGTATCNAVFLATDSGISLRIQYSGDTNFMPSQSSLQTLAVGRAQTVVNVSSTPNPAAPGQPATITATVSTIAPGAGSPAGTVSFIDGGVTLCANVTLSQTQTASCKANIPVSADQQIEVVYSGSPEFAGATGTLSQSVKHGYWLLGSDGGVFAFGAAQFHGSLPNSGFNPAGSGLPHSLQAPIVGIASTPDGNGYWLVGADGGVFAYGDAVFYGSTGSMVLNKPIVAMVPSVDGKGYWLVGSDGGVFAFGDAVFYGSTGSLKLSAPVVGMVKTADGKGYWLVGSDGGVFAFGDATFKGSLVGRSPASPVIGLAGTVSDNGYWLVTASGAVYPFGDASNYGGSPTSAHPIVAVSGSADGKGYWLVASNGGVFSYGDALFDGTTATMVLKKPIVDMTDI
jgi:hypothetical protein